MQMRRNSEEHALPYHTRAPVVLPFRDLNLERQRLRSYSQSSDGKDEVNCASKSVLKSHFTALEKEPDCFEKFRDLESQWNSVKSALHNTTVTPLRTNVKRGSYNFAIPEEAVEKSPSFIRGEVEWDTKEGAEAHGVVKANPKPENDRRERRAKTARNVIEEKRAAVRYACQKMHQVVKMENKSVTMGKARKSTPGRFQNSLLRGKKKKFEM